MNTAMQLLEETGSSLRAALANKDWLAIGELDMQCRRAVDEVMAAPVPDEALLRASMEELLGLYRQLVEACRAEQNRLASELRQLNQSQQGAKVYQLFG